MRMVKLWCPSVVSLCYAIMVSFTSKYDEAMVSECVYLSLYPSVMRPQYPRVVTLLPECGESVPENGESPIRVW